MSWAKVDDGWWCHPKTMLLSHEARSLWVSALSWSCAQRRDVIPARFLAMVGCSVAAAEELVAATFWEEADGGWRIHDWDEYQDRSVSEKRAEAGRKGGLARSKRQANASNDKQTNEANASKPANQTAKQVPIPTRPDPAEPVPTTLAVVPALSEPPKRTRKVYAAEFETWWREYPRNEEKDRAAKAYADARKEATECELLEALRAHKQAWEANGTEPKFIRYGERWLKNRRWLDPPPAVSRGAKGKAATSRQRIRDRAATYEGAS